MPGPQKSVFKKIKDAYWEVELVNKLCEHLRQIGVNATLLEQGSPETVGPTWKKGIFFSGYVLGCVKVVGRDIDLGQVERRGASERWHDRVGQMYLYQYILRANVNGLQSNLKDRSRSSLSGHVPRDKGTRDISSCSATGALATEE